MTVSPTADRGADHARRSPRVIPHNAHSLLTPHNNTRPRYIYNRAEILLTPCWPVCLWHGSMWCSRGGGGSPQVLNLTTASWRMIGLEQWAGKSPVVEGAACGSATGPRQLLRHHPRGCCCAGTSGARSSHLNARIVRRL